MTTSRILSLCGILFFLFLIAVPDTSATSCSTISFFVGDARTKLVQAKNETNFEVAKDYAIRAKSALGDAEKAAMDCNCTIAIAELDTAASCARRAGDSDNPADFVYNLNIAIRSLNSVIEALGACTGAP